MENKRITKPYRISTRFTSDEMILIEKYTRINGNPTIVSFIRECISQQIQSIMIEKFQERKDKKQRKDIGSMLH